MPRRLNREESQQQTRQRLLEAAYTVFGRRGYHAASLDAIAEEAGYSKGAVYSNFASKEELFLALLDHYTEEQMKGWEKIRELFAGPDQREVPKPENKDEAELTYVEYIKQDQSWIMLQLEFMLNALRDEKMRLEVAKRLRTMRQVMQEHLAAAHAANNTTPALPLGDLPLYMFSFDIGLSLQTLLDPDAIPEDAYMVAIKRLLG